MSALRPIADIAICAAANSVAIRSPRRRGRAASAHGEIYCSELGRLDHREVFGFFTLQMLHKSELAGELPANLLRSYAGLGDPTFGFLTLGALEIHGLQLKSGDEDHNIQQDFGRYNVFARHNRWRGSGRQCPDTPPTLHARPQPGDALS